MPAVSGVSAQPSSANHPGGAIRTQSRPAGRMPPKVGLADGPQRKAVTSRRLCGSTSARSVRRGSARNQTTPSWPSVQYFTSSSHSRLGGEGSCGWTPTSSASSGRSNVWCMANAPGAPLAAAALSAWTACTAGAGDPAYPISVCVPATTPAKDSAAPTGISAPRRQRARPLDRKPRHHRHEREGIARERGVLEQQMEDRIRHGHRQDGRERSAVAEQVEHGAERSQRQYDCSERPPFPGIHERVQQREGQRPRTGVEIEHLAAGKILSCLRAERTQVALQPAARQQERHAPRQGADGEGHHRADDRARHAAADAVDEDQGQERRGQPQRLRAEAHGQARHERAQDDHPAGCREELRRQSPVSPAVGRLPPPGREEARLCRQREHEAWQIAHGAHGQGPRQRSGQCQGGRGQRRHVERDPRRVGAAYRSQRREAAIEEERRNQGRQ